MGDSKKKHKIDAEVPVEHQLLSRPSSPPPSLGRKRIGRYEIIYPIAQGGMAGVYAGRLTGIAGFQRLVAIKIIHSYLSSDESFIKMFFDEARLSAGIHHPNIGEVFELGEDDGMYYMVCELIAGQSLRSLQRRAIAEKIHLSPYLIARIASVTALALQAAHDLQNLDGTPLNLVHRDVSPRNILLTYEGFVKLIDFGVAYAQNRLSKTDVGTIKGKIGYMSPEQLKCKPVDRRSDIFSLGVVLYEMTTNQSPFSGESDAERIDKILDHRFKNPRCIDPNIPPQLESIILRAMELDPSERYPTAAEMGEELDAFIKTSSETVDYEALSDLMCSLFMKERAYHMWKIRGHGTLDHDEDESPTAEITRNLRVKTTAGSDSRHSFQPDLEEIAIKNNYGGRGAIVAIVIMALLIVAYFFMDMNPSPSLAKTEKVTNKQTLSAVEKRLGTAEPITKTQDLEPSKQASGSLPSGMADTMSSVPLEEANITLDIIPSNAEVILDSVSYGIGTKIVQVPANGQTHHLRIIADGYIAHEEKIEATSDKTISISLVSKNKKFRMDKHMRAHKKKNVSKQAPFEDKTKSVTKDTGSSAEPSAASTEKKSDVLEASPYQ